MSAMELYTLLTSATLTAGFYIFMNPYPKMPVQVSVERVVVHLQIQILTHALKCSTLQHSRHQHIDEQRPIAFVAYCV